MPKEIADYYKVSTELCTLTFLGHSISGESMGYWLREKVLELKCLGLNHSSVLFPAV